MPLFTKTLYSHPLLPHHRFHLLLLLLLKLRVLFIFFSFNPVLFFNASCAFFTASVAIVVARPSITPMFRAACFATFVAWSAWFPLTLPMPA